MRVLVREMAFGPNGMASFLKGLFNLAQTLFADGGSATRRQSAESDQHFLRLMNVTRIGAGRRGRGCRRPSSLPARSPPCLARIEWMSLISDGPDCGPN